MMAGDLCFEVPEEEIEVNIVKIGSKMEVPKASLRRYTLDGRVSIQLNLMTLIVG